MGGNKITFGDVNFVNVPPVARVSDTEEAVVGAPARVHVIGLAVAQHFPRTPLNQVPILRQIGVPNFCRIPRLQMSYLQLIC